MTSATQSEEALHRAVAQFMDVALPADAVWWSVPNESPRSKAYGGRLKAKGMRRGVPDICICYRGRLICIELKSATERLTASQKAMHERITTAGGVVFTARSLDEVAELLAQLMPLRAKAA